MTFIVFVDLVFENFEKQSENLAWTVANRKFEALVHFIPVFGLEKHAQYLLLTKQVENYKKHTSCDSQVQRHQSIIVECTHV